MKPSLPERSKRTNFILDGGKARDETKRSATTPLPRQDAPLFLRTFVQKWFGLGSRRHRIRGVAFADHHTTPHRLCPRCLRKVRLLFAYLVFSTTVFVIPTTPTVL